jgi:TATA-binding protein-associated factor
VVPYLRHKEWETRSTAAKAIGKIIENAPLYDPNEDDGFTTEDPASENGFVKKEEQKDSILDEEEYFDLDALDVTAILKYGRPLLRGGTVDLAVAALDPQKRLLHQP